MVIWFKSENFQRKMEAMHANPLHHYCIAMYIRIWTVRLLQEKQISSCIKKTHNNYYSLAE